MSDFSKVVFQVCTYSFSCSGNVVSKLQRNDITGALVVLINALYDERMHDDVLKTTSRS